VSKASHDIQNAQNQRRKEKSNPRQTDQPMATLGLQKGSPKTMISEMIFVVYHEQKLQIWKRCGFSITKLSQS
jgi:hypothetical protein